MSKLIRKGIGYAIGLLLAGLFVALVIYSFSAAIDRTRRPDLDCGASYESSYLLKEHIVGRRDGYTQVALVQDRVMTEDEYEKYCQ